MAHFLLIPDISLSHAYLNRWRVHLSPCLPFACCTFSFHLEDVSLTSGEDESFPSLSLLKVEEFSLSARPRFAHFILYWFKMAVKEFRGGAADASASPSRSEASRRRKESERSVGCKFGDEGWICRGDYSTGSKVLEYIKALISSRRSWISTLS